MNKELYTPKQALNNIKYNYFTKTSGSDLERFWFNRVDKALKALEIIKEKEIDVHSFLLGVNINSYEDFIDKGRKYGWYTDEPSKQEYDLLKEILK